MGADIGLLEFVAFCNIHKRRLMMLLPDGVIDIVTAFATTLLDETWTPVSFARLAVCIVCDPRRWRRCKTHIASVYVPCTVF